MRVVAVLTLVLSPMLFLFDSPAFSQVPKDPGSVSGPPSAKADKSVGRESARDEPVAQSPIDTDLTRKERERKARIEESVRESLEHMKEDSFRTVILTVLLVIVGMFQLGVFWWQLWLLRRSTIDAGTAAEAAGKSATAAETTVATMKANAENQLRAYVFMNGFPYFSHLNPVTGTFWWSVHPVWKNGGSTPTKALFLNVSSSLRNDPLPANFDFPDAVGDTIPMVVGPESSIQASAVSISGKDLVDVRSGTKYFYIWGWAKYRDIFVGTPERVTRFCVRITSVTGDPEKAYHSATNIVEISFSFHSANNSLD
jgi:hypothetical protein